jgi:hypothetical protein
MENTRKELKLTSIAILVFAALSLVSVITSIIFGDFSSLADTPDGVLLASKIIVVVIAALILLPQVYVGVKGIKIAKAPVSTKAHIVWATILLVFAVISVLSQVGELSKAADMLDAILKIVDEVCIGVLYIFYILEAKKIRAGE